MIGLDGVWIKRGERQDAKPIAGTLIHDSESYRQGIVLLSMSAALPGRLLGATIVNAEALATLSQRSAPRATIKVKVACHCRACMRNTA
jgi:hypothetical protein